MLRTAFIAAALPGLFVCAAAAAQDAGGDQVKLGERLVGQSCVVCHYAPQLTSRRRSKRTECKRRFRHRRNAPRSADKRLQAKPGAVIRDAWLAFRVDAAVIALLPPLFLGRRTGLA